MHTLKKLAAAVAVAMAAGSAQAAIVDGNTSASELFVNVWDSTAQLSYHFDLGFTTDELLANPGLARSFDLSSDTNYSPFLSPQGSLVFNVSGFDGVLNDFPDLPSYGSYVTSNDAVGTSIAGWSSSQIDTLNGRISVHIGALNAVESNATANGAGNGSGTAGPGNGDAYFGANTWLTNYASAPFNNAAGVDEALAFWHVGSTDGQNAVATPFDNVWTLSNAGMLSFAPVSQVPVPAAVWLFGSGLVGLTGVARRKRVAVA